MKALLFCQNPYSFGILNPIKEELVKDGDEFLWYVTERLVERFPYKETDPFTTKIKDLVDFKPDFNFVPGNEIPHYIRGVKVQTFHGFAGEKKGHFRIRDYFDLYLTQGPFFTDKFNELKKLHKNFEVKQTGWPKLDAFSTEKNKFDVEKKELLQTSGAKKLILYAPTFSPSLTSAPRLIQEIENLSKNPEYLIHIKFHDLMKTEWISEYEKLSKTSKNIKIIKDHNILKQLIMADLMISDTSSVIYEFLLMDKPVVSINNSSNNIRWDDLNKYEKLLERVKINLNEDPFKKMRNDIFTQMHPYNDGLSAKRMLQATKDYINEFGIPESRKLSFLRRYKINKNYGRY